MLIVLFAVEPFFELIITLRAASGFGPSSSIRRCPSGSSSSSHGASCVFMFLMVGSMITGAQTPARMSISRHGIGSTV